MRRKNRKAHIGLTDRDRAILTNLWKWKVSTTSAIGVEFFGSPFSDAAYRRLRTLEKLDYMRQAMLASDGKYLWTLGKRGFDHIRPWLPELREDRYQPQFLWTPPRGSRSSR